MLGPPGPGKAMVAKRTPTIVPGLRIGSPIKKAIGPDVVALD
jgi:predicted ATPase with chaperone activity